MKQLLFTITILCLAGTIACTKTIYIPTEKHHKEYITLRDTIIEIVTRGESHSNHTTDTTSLLQGNGAYSIATISNGTLQHTLTIEPRQDSITIQVQEIHTIDSISYRHPPKEKESKATPSWVYLLIIITITAISTTCILMVLRIRNG